MWKVEKFWFFYSIYLFLSYTWKKPFILRHMWKNLGLWRYFRLHLVIVFKISGRELDTWTPFSNWNLATTSMESCRFYNWTQSTSSLLCPSTKTGMPIFTAIQGSVTAPSFFAQLFSSNDASSSSSLLASHTYHFTCSKIFHKSRHSFSTLKVSVSENPNQSATTATAFSTGVVEASPDGIRQARVGFLLLVFSSFMLHKYFVFPLLCFSSIKFLKELSLMMTVLSNSFHNGRNPFIDTNQ